MINIKHFHQFLQCYVKVDATGGVPLPDLNAFYNEFVRRQRANCQLSPNMFRSIFEMYVISLTGQYSIENATNRIPIVKGISMTSQTALNFMNLVRYSLLSESNPISVRSAAGHYTQLLKSWNSYVPKHLADYGGSETDGTLVSDLQKQIQDLTTLNAGLTEDLAKVQPREENN